MAWLKVYEWERKTYSPFWTIEIERHEQEKYLNKLSRHFKCWWKPKLSKRLKRSKLAGTYSNGYIRTGKATMLGVICHEFAHHLTQVRYDDQSGHGRHFKHELKRIYTWAKRWLPKGGNHETSKIQADENSQSKSYGDCDGSENKISETVLV